MRIMRVLSYSVPFHPSVMCLDLLEAVLVRLLGERAAPSSLALLPRGPALGTLLTTIIPFYHYNILVEHKAKDKHLAWVHRGAQYFTCLVC